MIDPLDRFEAELRSLRPRDGSVQARRRIAERLGPRRPGRSMLALVAAAACLIAGLVAWRMAGMLTSKGTARPGDPVAARPGPRPPVANPIARHLATAGFGESLPTLWEYHCALARSTADLDALLTRPSPELVLVPDEPLLAMGQRSPIDR